MYRFISWILIGLAVATATQIATLVLNDRNPSIKMAGQTLIEKLDSMTMRVPARTQFAQSVSASNLLACNSDGELIIRVGSKRMYKLPSEAFKFLYTVGLTCLTKVLLDDEAFNETHSITIERHPQAHLIMVIGNLNAPSAVVINQPNALNASVDPRSGLKYFMRFLGVGGSISLTGMTINAGVGTTNSSVGLLLDRATVTVPYRMGPTGSPTLILNGFGVAVTARANSLFSGRSRVTITGATGHGVHSSTGSVVDIRDCVIDGVPNASPKSSAVEMRNGGIVSMQNAELRRFQYGLTCIGNNSLASIAGTDFTPGSITFETTQLCLNQYTSRG